ncbi:energy transducer TonB [Nostoc parmelioides]|uniref:Energy transducer TonB n=1 Tax=Nostoc parmelioides FACHB-3921 TaxID=2692909 RepID=A0ABR8BJE5_9NOSO|nr:energy transducer TonB [Nostoc parmelioides]MBD2253824.1 energy transducer TonB [Nostoc parmelioides FACHB-3921]
MSLSSVTSLTYGAIAVILLQTNVLSSEVDTYLLPIPSQKYQINLVEQVQPLTGIKTQFLQVQAPETNARKLVECLTKVRDSRINQNNSVSAIPVELNNSSPFNISTDSASSNTNVTNETTGNRQSVGTELIPPKIHHSSNSRADCFQGECSSKNPQAARRQTIESRVEVAVDTDDKGNVTNVRLLRSSGNRVVDEEHLRQARTWRLKPSPTGRQGVFVGTQDTLKDSCRSLELQERGLNRRRRQ